MVCKRGIGTILMGIFLGVLTASVSAETLQQRIDAAKAGEVIEVPAGVYQETIVIKSGVWLVGAGPDQTVLDAGGAANAVKLRNQAVLMGFTVRNAVTGVSGADGFAGIFNCRVTGMRAMGVNLNRGGGVVANSWIEGNGTSLGVLLNACSAWLVNNTVAGHTEGVHAGNYFDPTLRENRIVDNKTGLVVGPGMQAILEKNLFARNSAGDVKGQAAPAVDPAAVAPGQPTQPEPLDLEACRQMMKKAEEDQVTRHPLLVYDLGETLGAFDVTAFFNWATFAVSASEPQTTRIEQYEAYDLVGEKPLEAQFQADYSSLKLPTVLVNSPAILEQGTYRYALQSRYETPPSYYREDSGALVFKRETTVTNLQIVLPAGQIPTAVNYPATFERKDGRVVVKIVSIGTKKVEIRMRAEGAGEDPYHLLTR
jgi:hypothetical protein